MVGGGDVRSIVRSPRMKGVTRELTRSPLTLTEVAWDAVMGTADHTVGGNSIHERVYNVYPQHGLYT